MDWYALQVRSRFENHVKLHLEDRGFEIYLPTFESKRQWSDRTKVLSLPLFPGYVFCKLDVHNRLPVLTTPGVNSIVGVGRTPARIEVDEIHAIRRVVDSGIATVPWPYLQVGERINIEKGPLEGLEGIVV